MEIKDMNLAELEARALELCGKAETADLEALKVINTELDAIQERKSALLEEANLRKKALTAVAGGAGKAVGSEKSVEERKKEFLGSAEYSDLYAEYMKTGKETEIRTALKRGIHRPQDCRRMLKIRVHAREVITLSQLESQDHGRCQPLLILSVLISDMSLFL